MTEKHDNEVLNLAPTFALQLIQALNNLPKTTSNGVLVKQCLRSGTSVGANIEEAVGASSRKEFTHCMTIARREARETRYWLRLLAASNPGTQTAIVPLGETVNSLLRLLNSIVKTSRAS